VGSVGGRQSLETNNPDFMRVFRQEGTGKPGIEGHFLPGDTLLIIDDSLHAVAAFSRQPPF